MNENPVDNKVDNSIAAIWSMMLPGLGQLLKGQVMPGIFWALGVAAGYFLFFWPGLILHFFCILDAAFNKGDIGQTKIGMGILLLLLLSYIVYRNF